MLNRCKYNIFFLLFRFFRSYILANFSKSALITFWSARLTHVPAMKEQPMMCSRNDIIRQMLHQFSLYGIRSSTRCRHKSKSPAHSVYVSIDSHCCLTPYYSLNHICGLSSHSWQFGQLFKRVGYLTTIFLHEHTRQSHQMLSFIVRVTHTFDIFKYHLFRSFSHNLSCRIVSKQAWSHHVDTLVCTLSREHHSNKQLKRAAIVKFRIDNRHLTLKILNYSGV